jgi:crotonobetaine/carnitine-CoA ligase
MFTSGTSGPSKGVRMPHAHCGLFGQGTIDALGLGAGDRYYIALPLFHANGLLMQLGATLLAGIEAVIRPRFSASAWLDDIGMHRATVTNLLGVTAAFVLAQPPTPKDRGHMLRAIVNAPNPAEHDAELRERFGVTDVVSGYGMTEVNIVSWGCAGRPAPGAAGWVQDDRFEVIVADPDTDRTLATGETGEILVRPRLPGCFMSGYHDEPGKTVEAWRNLWFHTGDAGRLDADGRLWFVDRLKDCIRRRGENISAAEIESALLPRLQGVAELVAYAVPASQRGGEDEVMLAVLPAAGQTPDLRDIRAAACEVLPKFAWPRYLHSVLALPRTATGKVQRAVLRAQGVGPDTFDAEASTR